MKPADYIATINAAVTDALERYTAACDNKALSDGMRYALTTGGKRVRPTLMLASAEAIGVPMERIMPIAVGLEFIHTYSLVHDDLPCMDNDDFRRGQPTVHKLFGEGMATLIGDGLLNAAYEILLDAVVRDAELKRCAACIASAAGASGMVCGQATDITATDYDESGILAMYAQKTGALIRAAILAPHYIGQNSPSAEYIKLAESVGLIFQLVDDCLDLADGTDKDKITYATLFGAENAHTKIDDLQHICDRAFASLNIADSDLSEYISALTHRIK